MKLSCYSLLLVLASSCASSSNNKATVREAIDENNPAGTDSLRSILPETTENTAPPPKTPPVKKNKK